MLKGSKLCCCIFQNIQLVWETENHRIINFQKLHVINLFQPSFPFLYFGMFKCNVNLFKVGKLIKEANQVRLSSWKKYVYSDKSKTKYFIEYNVTIKTISARNVQSHALSSALKVSDSQQEITYIFTVNLSEKSSN